MNVMSRDPKIQECKIIEQLKSLSIYSASLHSMANRMFALTGRLIRLQETIYTKDTGDTQFEKYRQQAELDYKAATEYANNTPSYGESLTRHNRKVEA